ncbi:flagellar hook-basal body complex protein FliE [Desulfohalobium retbaense]|uniref:Flagellar hook-basal body complex protein FliE n=1 Tax=Desulfohalobium retbaense (strain ATCC 49708 / DSM 5692 / JCM 16813 / HR100) TaxID=485915 RepID=C8X0K0_DESRD|nr:flagellar hook-basal body complex protein FliE [Desulfohalobium retbaense]ACV67947.1 flagellar hook-basal body complex subunit FliE [Desulfohalobium retbaense DSM 5692]
MPVIDPSLAAGAANFLEQSGAANAGGQQTPVESFRDTLLEAVQEVDSQKKTANTAILDSTTGGGTSIHETMVAMEKAGTSMKLMVQVRNKAMDAYKEIMRMQV